MSTKRERFVTLAQASSITNRTCADCKVDHERTVNHLICRKIQMAEQPISMRNKMRKSFNRTKAADEMLSLPQVNINKMNTTQLWTKATYA